MKSACVILFALVAPILASPKVYTPSHSIDGSSLASASGDACEANSPSGTALMPTSLKPQVKGHRGRQDCDKQRYLTKQRKHKSAPSGVDSTAPSESSTETGGTQAPIQQTSPPSNVGNYTSGYQLPPTQTDLPGQGAGGQAQQSSYALASSPVSAPPSTSGTVISSGGVTLPANCEQKNGIDIGWLSSDVPLSTIESTLGSKACWLGKYAQIFTGGAYTDVNHQLLGYLSDISTPGQTIFVASVMPTIPMAQIDAAVADGVAKVLSQFTDKGIEVWLRYAHEMNYYTTAGSTGGHYVGTSNDFQQSWAVMSTAMQSNTKIKMFWSPNSASSADLQQWYPKSGRVDVVGIDIYPKEQQTFADTYGDFCKAFSTAGIPFMIGETAAGPSLKEYWLGQLVSPEAKTACPHYIGFQWFEYNKEQDFRVVTGGNDIAKKVLG